jgi:predicted ATP-grasp superfamily ATP-dependent carboligase
MKTAAQQTIVVIGGGSSQVPFIVAAKECGLKTIVFDQNPSCPAVSLADRFFAISTHHADKIVESLIPFRNELTSCFTYSSFHAAQNVVAVVNEYFDLVGLNSESLLIGSDKSLFKSRLRNVGLLTPRSLLIKDPCEGMGFIDENIKTIVKPAMGSCGSAGVSLITQPNDEYIRRSQEAVACSIDKSIILEEFIEGAEYSIDGFVDSAGVKILLVSRKYTLGCEYGYAIDGFTFDPSQCSSFLENYLVTIKKAVLATNLMNSFFSFDVIVSDGNIYFIDFGCLLDAKIDCLMSYVGAAVYAIPSLIPNGAAQSFGGLPVVTTPVSLRFAYLNDETELLKYSHRASVALNKSLSFMPFNNCDSVGTPPESVSDSVGMFLCSGDQVEKLWSAPWALDLITGY